MGAKPVTCALGSCISEKTTPALGTTTQVPISASGAGLAGAEEFIKELRKELAKYDLQEEINVLETGPLGFFGKGICLTVYPENITYQDVKIEDIPELVEEHFLKGRPVKRLMLDTTGKYKPRLNYEKRIVLRNSGVIDPENIE